MPATNPYGIDNPNAQDDFSTPEAYAASSLRRKMEQAASTVYGQKNVDQARAEYESQAQKYANSQSWEDYQKSRTMGDGLNYVDPAVRAKNGWQGSPENPYDVTDPQNWDPHVWATRQATTPYEAWAKLNAYNLGFSRYPTGDELKLIPGYSSTGIPGVFEVVSPQGGAPELKDGKTGNWQKDALVNAQGTADSMSFGGGQGNAWGAGQGTDGRNMAGGDPNQVGGVNGQSFVDRNKSGAIALADAAFAALNDPRLRERMGPQFMPNAANPYIDALGNTSANILGLGGTAAEKALRDASAVGSAGSAIRSQQMNQVNQTGADLDQLRQLAAGKGPSAAASLAQGNLDQSIAGMAGVAAMARGGNVLGANRQAMNAGATQMLQQRAQTAALRSQEQINAATALPQAGLQASQALALARGQDIDAAYKEGALTGDLAKGMTNAGISGLGTTAGVQGEAQKLYLAAKQGDAAAAQALVQLLNQQLGIYSGVAIQGSGQEIQRDIANDARFDRYLGAGLDAFGVGTLGSTLKG